MANGGIIGRLMVVLGLDNSKYTQGLEQSKSKTKKDTAQMEGSFDKLGSSIGKIGGIIAAAFSVRAIVGFLNESAKLAGVAEGVKTAFDRLNQPDLLGSLRKATNGTVDDLQLMQNAIQAKNFKIPLENLASYLKFANQRAKETGQSVDYLVQSIVLGVGRRSPLILDNLGIGLKETREEFNKTGDMAKAVSNIIDREMATAGTSVITLADKSQQAKASWTNMMLALGNTSAVSKVKAELLDLKKTFADVWKSNLTLFEKIAATLTPGGLALQSTILTGNEDSEFKKKNDQLNRYNAMLDENMANIKNVTDAEKTLSFVLSQQKSEYNNIWAQRLKNYIISQKEEEDRKKSISGIQSIVDELTEQLNIETDPKRQRALAAEINSYTKKKEAIESMLKVQENDKTFSYKESETNASLAALEKQRTAYGGTIAFLDEELKLKRQLEWFAKNDDELRKIQAENNALEKRLNLLKKPSVSLTTGSEAQLKNVISEAEKEIQNLNTTTTEGRARFLELNSTIKETQILIDKLPQNLKIKIDTDFSEFENMSDTYIDDILSGWKETQERNRQFNEEFNQILENGAIAGIAGLGAAIGALASDNGSDAWQMMLSPIADVMIQLGQLAIGAGIAIEAIKKSLEFLGPFAIPAGVALVALGTAIKGSMSNLAKGGGTSAGSYNTFTGGGGGYSNNGALSPDQFRQQQQIQVSGEFKLEGRNLVAAIDNTKTYGKR